VVARIEKMPGASQRIALPTGRYVVRKVRQEDVLVGEVDLVWGGDRWIDDTRLSSVALGDPLARGGWGRRRTRVDLHAIGAPPFLAGNPSTAGGGLEVRSALGPRAQVVFGGNVAVGARREWGGDLRVGQGRLAVGLAWVRPLRHVDVGLGGGLAAVGVLQRLRYLAPDDDGLIDVQEQFGSVAPSAWVDADLRLGVGPAVGLVLGARGSLIRATVDEQAGFYLHGEARAGVSFAVR
jgi:hypothetical protein